MAGSVDLTAIPWPGGKSAKTKQPYPTGRWIASMLPPDTNVTYIEPFAGMLGVLLQRPRSSSEIVNDLDSRLVNWWRCVRDETEELQRLIALTPNSREEYNRACAAIETQPAEGVQSALDFTIVVLQSIMQSPNPVGWLTRYISRRVDWRNGLDGRLLALRDRLAYVAIENRDACDLLDRVASVPNALICADPPYPSAEDSALYAKPVDIDRLTASLSAQQGRVAVSGYGDEWDHLGWERHEHKTITNTGGSTKGTLKRERVEVLWTNYPVEWRLL